jgi:WD40 repeat protein
MNLSAIATAIDKVGVVFARWIDSFWGYDVFIAHRRADAAEYAKRLYDTLNQEKISCFIDKVVFGAGDSLLVATSRHVTKSTLFLLVGSPALLTPRKPDWVEREIETYLTSHQADPKVILVDFGMTVANALGASGTFAATPNPILPMLEPFLRIPEELPALALGPSELVLDAVRRNLSGRRRDRTRLRFFQGAAFILAALLVTVTALGIANERSRKYTEARRLQVEARANLASPSATQTAIAQARAALLMADSAESREVAQQIIDRLMVPVTVMPTPEIGNVTLFGAFRSDGKLLVNDAGPGRLLSPEPNGAWSDAPVPAREGCRLLRYSADGEWTSCLDARRVRVWNVLTDLTALDAQLSPALFGDEPMVALDHDGKRLVVGERGRITSIDIGTGTKSEVAVPAEGGAPIRIAVSPDGHLVAIVPSVTSINAKFPVFLVDTRTGSVEAVTEQLAAIKALEFSASGDRLAVGTEDGRIEIIAINSKRIELQFQSLPGLIAISFSRDDRFLGVGAESAASVYSVSTGAELAKASTDGPVYHVSFDSGATRFLTAGAGANRLSARIVLWNLHGSADFASALYMPNEEVSSVGFDAAGRLIQATWSALRVVDLKKNEVAIRDKIPGYQINQIQPAAGREALLLVRNISALKMAVYTLAGIPVGREFDASLITTTPDAGAIAYLQRGSSGLSTPARDSQLGLWRASRLADQTASVPESASSIALDAAARYLIVTFDARPGVPARLAVYGADGLNKLSSIDGKSLRLEAAVAPDGQTVLVADGNLLVTRRLPGLEVVRSVVHWGDIKEFTFSATGDRYAVADGSGTVSVFHANGNILTSRQAFFEGSRRHAISFSPDGKLLLVHYSLIGRASMRLISSSADGLDEQLCARLLREPGRNAWQAILPNDRPPPACNSHLNPVLARVDVDPRSVRR